MIGQPKKTFQDECGVFGILGHSDAVGYTASGLIALQHRGQDSAGIAVCNGGGITRLCRAGLASNLTGDKKYKKLKGTAAIGHVRYSTVGGSSVVNAQPLLLDCRHGTVALCHNGQIVNFDQLKTELSTAGVVWETSSDSELVLQLCKASRGATIVDAIIEALGHLRGAFSILMLTKRELIAARDPHGFRPLCLGQLDDATIVCSETCALDGIGARYSREIEPGEIAVIDASGIQSFRYSSVLETDPAHCIFEHVYFARPDSAVFGQNVGAVRMELGRALAREYPVRADVIVPVPDSGLWAAVGFQEESQIPLCFGLVRNSYVGRTFIKPSFKRSAGSRRLKLNPVRSILDGKRVVLIDDSIVRGETMAAIVKFVREAGASEVHVRISSPPIIAPCFYGINTPTKSELIAADRPIDDIRAWICADSLQYLSLWALLDAVGTERSGYCTACYTGEYRVLPPSMPRSFPNMHRASLARHADSLLQISTCTGQR